jgi:hypothetical protein
MGKYTSIDDPSAYFQATTYTGAGADTEVTNSGNSDLKPDWLWIKNRTADYGHFVVDSNRNISYAQNSSNAPYLETESTAAENNNQNWMASVNTNGFTTGISEHINNNLGSEYVAWQWKANGGTTASNTDGDITSTVQANTDAGFSIITYTGNGSTANQTVGHGLGVRANAVIVKNRDAAVNWVVYVDGLTVNHSLELNTTDGESDSTQGRVLSSSAGSYGTSSIFTLRSGSSSVIQTNTSGEDYVAYCFAEKQGYSKFGSYVGNGNVNGAFVYTGFKPAFVMVKAITSGKNWDISTGAVSSNQIDERLRANITAAEESSGHIDFLSNGFKMRNTNGTQNSSGVTYIYMAFAENPFTTSTGIPTTAR